MTQTDLGPNAEAGPSNVGAAPGAGLRSPSRSFSLSGKARGKAPIFSQISTYTVGEGDKLDQSDLLHPPLPSQRSPVTPTSPFRPPQLAPRTRTLSQGEPTSSPEPPPPPVKDLTHNPVQMALLHSARQKLSDKDKEAMRRLRSQMDLSDTSSTKSGSPLSPGFPGGTGGTGLRPRRSTLSKALDDEEVIEGGRSRSGSTDVETYLERTPRPPRTIDASCLCSHGLS